MARAARLRPQSTAAAAATFRKAAACGAAPRCRSPDRSGQIELYGILDRLCPSRGGTVWFTHRSCGCMPARRSAAQSSQPRPPGRATFSPSSHRQNAAQIAGEMVQVTCWKSRPRAALYSSPPCHSDDACLIKIVRKRASDGQIARGWAAYRALAPPFLLSLSSLRAGLLGVCIVGDLGGGFVRRDQVVKDLNSNTTARPQPTEKGQSPGK